MFCLKLYKIISFRFGFVCNGFYGEGAKETVGNLHLLIEFYVICCKSSSKCVDDDALWQQSIAWHVCTPSHITSTLRERLFCAATCSKVLSIASRRFSNFVVASMSTYLMNQKNFRLKIQTRKVLSEHTLSDWFNGKMAIMYHAQAGPSVIVSQCGSNVGMQPKLFKISSLVCSGRLSYHLTAL